MKILLLLFVVFVAACSAKRSRRNTPPDDFQALLKRAVFDKIDECKEVHGVDAGENLPNCATEVKECFKNARTKSMECLSEEKDHWMQKEGMKECGPDNKEAMLAWFKAVCKTTLSVKKCMAGEAAPESFKFPHTHHQHGAKPHSHAKQFQSGCWAGVGTKYAECHGMGVEQCDNYKHCAGKVQSDDAQLQEWYEIAHHNKHEMGYKIKTAMTGIKECLERKKQEADDTFLFF